MKKRAEVDVVYREKQKTLDGEMVVEVYTPADYEPSPHLEFQIHVQHPHGKEAVALSEPDAGMLMDMLGRGLSAMNQPGSMDREASISERVAARFVREANVRVLHRMLQKVADLLYDTARDETWEDEFQKRDYWTTFTKTLRNALNTPIEDAYQLARDLEEAHKKAKAAV
jgi:hypothetical protein